MLAAAMKRAHGMLLALGLGIGALAAPRVASAQTSPGEVLAPLRVGTKETPPFVVRAPTGELEGPSLELWRAIAGDLGVSFELEERDLEGLFRGLEDGTLDIAVAALTITAERERRVDFTHPFHTTGLAIAIAKAPGEGWFDVFVAVFTASFLRLVMAFALLQMLFGALMWLFERRRNPHFQGPPSSGLAAGIWWSVVTMATVGYGDKVPVTGAGRVLAMTWMLVSLIVLTTLTASITTSLTIGRLEARVSGPQDLSKLRVGAARGATGEAFLREMKLNYRSFDDSSGGLSAIEAGQIDAFVHDEPILSVEIEASHRGSIELLPRTFQRQDYAFALPTGSSLREPINQSLVRRIGEHGERGGLGVVRGR